MVLTEKELKQLENDEWTFLETSQPDERSQDVFFSNSVLDKKIQLEIIKNDEEIVIYDENTMKRIQKGENRNEDLLEKIKISELAQRLKAAIEKSPTHRLRFLYNKQKVILGVYIVEDAKAYQKEMTLKEIYNEKKVGIGRKQKWLRFFTSIFWVLCLLYIGISLPKNTLDDAEYYTLLAICAFLASSFLFILIRQSRFFLNIWKEYKKLKK